jgi:hypothetical protein
MMAYNLVDSDIYVVLDVRFSRLDFSLKLQSRSFTLTMCRSVLSLYGCVCVCVCVCVENVNNIVRQS